MSRMYGLNTGFVKSSVHPIHQIIAGHEEEILALHGLYPPRARHMLCPLHDDHDPSFRWDFDSKRWFCTCGNGDIIDLVARLAGVDFNGAVERILAKDFKPIDAAEMAERRRQQAAREENKYRLSLNTARWRWASSKPAKRTCVEVYLREVRGLFRNKPLPEVLRFLPADPRDSKWRGCHRYPAMIAPFSFMPAFAQPPNWEGIEGVHLTFLKPSGYDKAMGKDSKIIIGRRSNYPVVLRHPGHHDHPGRALIIAEGIETAAAYWHRPAGIWASGTAGRLPFMGDFLHKCHPFVDRIYVVVDDDDAGREHSAELAEYVEEQGIHAHLIGPGVAS